ncbi:MAG: copper resistance CopC family protein [Actinoplanes sp.]
MSRTVRRWAAVLVVLPALVWLVTVVARQRETPAPMTLVSSTPGAGAVLPSAPGGVDLRWSTPPDARLSHVVVEDSDGRTVPSGTLRTDPGNVLHLPITGDAKGIYTLGYHVVGIDGGESTGSMRFSIDAGPVPPGPAPAVKTHEHGIDPASASLLLINFAVVAGAVIMLLLRPRPRRPIS